MKLCYYGNPILRKRAEPVAEITQEIRDIIEGMTKIMLDNNGIGIAAPQVGVGLRIFVSIVEGQDEEGDILYMDPIAYINPEISNLSTSLSEMEEGCLSLPGLSVPVLRPLSVDIKAIDIEGNPIEKSCDDFLARHILHEYDHLEGILTIDHLKGRKRTAFEPALRRMKKKYAQS